jgi:lipopolysaccharide transport system permease protein
MGTFAALWSFRGFILGSVLREFQGKYRNSLLGVAWIILNPLALMFVYIIIFSHVMRSKLPGVDGQAAYGIYLCSGLLTWGFFAEVVGRGQTVFTGHSNLLKKVKFPRTALPVIVVLNATLNFSIVFSLFLVYLAISGNWPGWVGLAVVPVLAVQIVLSLGLSVFLGILNVFFRDFGHLTGIVLQFWFWLTPIVYPVGILPEAVRQVLAFNPMYPVIAGYQEIFVMQRVPQWSDLWIPLVLGLILCVTCLRLFRRRAAEIVDEL